MKNFDEYIFVEGKGNNNLRVSRNKKKRLHQNHQQK